MQLPTRKLLDRSFTALSALSILFMCAAVVILLLPIIIRGMDAFLFKATVEHRRILYEKLKRGRYADLQAELEEANAARQPAIDLVMAYEKEVKETIERQKVCFCDGPDAVKDVGAAERQAIQKAVADAVNAHRQALETELAEKKQQLGECGKEEGRAIRGDVEQIELCLRLLREQRQKLLTRGKEAVLDDLYRSNASQAARFEGALLQIEGLLTRSLSRAQELKDYLRTLLGPLPGDTPVLPREEYGQTRWDSALYELHRLQSREVWVRSDPKDPGSRLVQSWEPRRQDFVGTSVEPLFDLMTEDGLRKMLHPQTVFYWRFLFDESFDAHLFGGIGAEVLGTIFLTVGAMIFALPMGVIAAIYLAEYAQDTTTVSILRSCISTLAGVPSIVFGLFGLAFFINTIGVSESKSVLAGALTLALLILPTIIRASEEAILAVPRAYKEAAMGLGASHWHTIVTVIVPAALPGILTGIVISMGRAAGETAPIIFTAAVSMGPALGLGEIFSQPTRALPWNIYNVCTESEVADKIVHVQFGMVLTLVMLVLVLNAAAIIIRARIQKKLRG